MSSALGVNRFNICPNQIVVVEVFMFMSYSKIGALHLYCIDLVRFNKWIKQSLTNKLLDYTGGCNQQRSNVGNGNSTVIKDEFAFAYPSYF